uniref:Uncharacterized protein n=1 Tax=Anguilla anguilla TaxID=7936 RepID=A0A0E9S7J7_ANGAN
MLTIIETDPRCDIYAYLLLGRKCVISEQ